MQQDKQLFVKKISSIVVKLMIVISATIGILSTMGMGGFMGGTKTLLFFTVQSNIWIAAICLIFVVLEIIGWIKGINLKRNWLYIIKFMFTVSITLTFLVFAVLLAPQIIKIYPSYLSTPSNLCCHYITPILAIIDFTLFDTDWDSKRKHSLFSAIMPLYYLVFSMICSVSGVAFDDKGTTVPYFFLDYKTFGWFRIGDGGIGVFYWIVIIVILVLGMGLGFYAINRLMKKTKFARII